MNKNMEQVIPTYNNTWEEVSKAKCGTIFKDIYDEGVRFIIMKGGSSLCAYAGVPEDHPLAGFDYEDLPIEAHGGLTYAGKGGDGWPDGWYFYGWDYAHSGDHCDYYDNNKLGASYISTGKKWTVEMVEKDSWNTIYELKKLMKVAERIKNKPNSY